MPENGHQAKPTWLAFPQCPGAPDLQQVGECASVPAEYQGHLAPKGKDDSAGRLCQGKLSDSYKGRDL